MRFFFFFFLGGGGEGHRRWLRATAYVFTLSTSIVRVLVRPWPLARVNPYRGCAEIVRKSCNLSGVAVQSPQPPDDNRTEPVRLPCRGCADIVRWPWRHRTVLSVRPPRGARAGIVRCHLRHIYGLRTYDFSNLYNFSLNKIVEAPEPVNPYGGLAEAARKGGYGQDTGSVDPSQAKCELGIRLPNLIYGAVHWSLWIFT